MPVARSWLPGLRRRCTAWHRPGTVAMPRSLRFGQVWPVKGGVMGPEQWMLVSSDLYLELDVDNMHAVPVLAADSAGWRVVTEHLPGIGVAVLDRVTALPRTWLIGSEPTGQLAEDRTEEVGRRIRNLIGP
jgi:hypothetical protein